MLCLNNSAKQKVTTGWELHVAEATAADVSFIPMLYAFKVKVFLEIS
jgi:hypothetical protein